MICSMKFCKNYCYSLCTNWLFMAFLLFAIAIAVFHLNLPLFMAINNLHTVLPDFVWLVLNSVTHTKYAVLAAILFLLTLIFRRDKLRQVVILIVAFYVLFVVLKIFVGEARPYIVIPEGTFFWLKPDGSFLGISLSEDIAASAYRSFPSGHVGQTAVFVFAIINLFFPRNMAAKIIFFLFLLLIGFARICTGWHWPLDVVASGLIAYALVKLCLCNKDEICSKEQ